MDQSLMIIAAMIALAAVNITAIKYLGIFGLLFTAACFPLAEKLLDMIGKL